MFTAPSGYTKSARASDPIRPGCCWVTRCLRRARNPGLRRAPGLGCGAARLVRRWPGTHTGTMRRQPTDPVFAAEPLPPSRLCDHPGCECGGDFRAPRSRLELDRYYWFCLEHVRAYNVAWNYYRGMSEPEIEAEIRRDTVWQRPSWKLGGRHCPIPGVRAPFGLYKGRE